MVPAARIITTAATAAVFALVHAISFNAPLTRVQVELRANLPQPRFLFNAPFASVKLELPGAAPFPTAVAAIVFYPFAFPVDNTPFQLQD